MASLGECMNRLRVYVDASVVGGCHDDGFREPSVQLFAMARDGHVLFLMSELLAIELEDAPAKVRQSVVDLPPDCVEPVTISEEALDLRRAYLAAGVVGVTHGNDALHVALATVARADLVVSWNFKHIVHFDKIRGFNAVNLREGYLPIEIRSPLEVV